MEVGMMGTLTMTKWTLFALLGTNGTAWVSLADGRRGILQSVQRESGCGWSFIATVAVPNKGRVVGDAYVEVYIRTTD
jgi:hypothetical protein